MPISFDPDTHTYTIDGVEVPSVTTVCRFLSYDQKSAAMENICREGREAVAALAAMGLNPAVFGALCEILTAQ